MKNIGLITEIYPYKLLVTDTICYYMKEITKKLDLQDWGNFGGQALHLFIVTKLVNNISIIIEESMAIFCHGLVSAYYIYIERSSYSEYNKYHTLGLFRHI